jgi:hypothetical protein
VAPQTAKRASLQKNGGANAGAVVDSKFLDFEYDAERIHQTCVLPLTVRGEKKSCRTKCPGVQTNLAVFPNCVKKLLTGGKKSGFRL